MGGGDLNLKKSWHPATFKNIELVYKREKAQEEEDKKLLQLRKELEEERQREKLQSEAEAAGRVKKKSSRLEWMYAASSNQDGAVDEDKEAYLLGRRRIDNLVQEKSSIDSSYSKSNNAFYGFQANSDKDFQSKVREDPLLAIRKREKLSVEAVLANPFQLKKIKRSHARSPKRSRERSPKREKERRRERSSERDRRSRERSRERRERSPISHRSRERERSSHRSREIRGPKYSSRKRSLEKSIDTPSEGLDQEKLDKLAAMQAAASNLEKSRLEKLKSLQLLESATSTKSSTSFSHSLRQQVVNSSNSSVANMVSRNKFFSLKEND